MPAPRWTDLGEGIHVRQSVHYAMNSVVLLDPEHALVIDPGILPGELDEIATVVRGIEPEAVTLVFTHHHWDHVLGRHWWPRADTLAHDNFAKLLAGDVAHARAEAQRLADAAGQRWPRPHDSFTPTDTVSGLHFRKIEPWRIVLRNAAGHCASQINVHLPESRVLIAADMLSDIEIPALDSPPDVYRSSLDALLPIAHGGAIETLIPGHGSIAHGRDAVLARLQADYDYLDAIEHEAREAVAAGRTAEASADALAAMEYPGKHSTEYPMVEIHRQNILRAHSAAVASRSNGKRPAPR